jgi:hypothetical protein
VLAFGLDLLNLLKYVEVLVDVLKEVVYLEPCHKLIVFETAVLVKGIQQETDATGSPMALL